MRSESPPVGLRRLTFDQATGMAVLGAARDREESDRPGWPPTDASERRHDLRGSS